MFRLKQHTRPWNECLRNVLSMCQANCLSAVATRINHFHSIYWMFTPDCSLRILTLRLFVRRSNLLMMVTGVTCSRIANTVGHALVCTTARVMLNTLRKAISRRQINNTVCWLRPTYWFRKKTKYSPEQSGELPVSDFTKLVRNFPYRSSSLSNYSDCRWCRVWTLYA